MRKKYLYRVGLAILPVWMGRYIELVGEKSTDSVVNVLINGIFGRVTGDSGSRFVIAIGQAIFLVLFLILYFTLFCVKFIFETNNMICRKRQKL